MTQDLTDRLERVSDGLKALHQHEHAEAIDRYAEEIGKGFQRATSLIEARRARNVGYRRDPVERWAARVCGIATERAFLTRDPRLEQSLRDLIRFLEDERRSVTQLPSAAT